MRNINGVKGAYWNIGVKPEKMAKFGKNYLTVKVH